VYERERERERDKKSNQLESNTNQFERLRSVQTQTSSNDSNLMKRQGMIGECGRRGGYMEICGMDKKVLPHIQPPWRQPRGKSMDYLVN
jgi:hypothetical protein